MNEIFICLLFVETIEVYLYILNTEIEKKNLLKT